MVGGVGGELDSVSELAAISCLCELINSLGGSGDCRGGKVGNRLIGFSDSVGEFLAANGGGGGKVTLTGGRGKVLKLGNGGRGSALIGLKIGVLGNGGTFDGGGGTEKSGRRFCSAGVNSKIRTLRAVICCSGENIGGLGRATPRIRA